MKTYEGLFLLEAGQPNFEQAAAPVRTVLERSGAEILQFKKWDERRLAYEIRGRKRGLYVLTYFRAAPEKITEIEHDVRLNDAILRAMILQAEHVSAEKMAAPTPAETEPGRRDEDGERSDDWGDDRPRRRRPERVQAAPVEDVPAVDALADEPSEAQGK